MDAVRHFAMLATYNRIANERMYRACAELEDSALRKTQQASFGSIHALLNHMLLGDRIWMARFRGGGATTPALNTVLFDSFAELSTARFAEDRAIEQFFSSPAQEFFERTFAYVNNKGLLYEESAEVALPHFFNHQTHHRGQVHVLLNQAGVAPPSLDLHRIANP